MTTLFISDLHLDAAAPAITRQFLQFLSGRGRDAERLYILGDLFEVWVGDDDDDAHTADVLGALRDFAESGVDTFFMRGNRDFIAGDGFAERAGCTLLADPHLAQFDGQRVLLSHGDAYCTDDHEYQAFRLQTRSPAWQQQILALPLAERRQLARNLREQSHLAMAGKSAAIMDVNSDAIAAVITEYDVTTMVHGHTHRPCVHRHALGGRQATRIVLGDWYDQASFLALERGRWRLAVEPR